MSMIEFLADYAEAVKESQQRQKEQEHRAKMMKSKGKYKR